MIISSCDLVTYHAIVIGEVIKILLKKLIKTRDYMKSTKCLCNLLLLCMIIASLQAPRSIHRPYDPCMPEITTFWTDDNSNPTKKKTYSLRSYYLSEWAIFGRYDKELLEKNQLPAQISYHYEPNKSVNAEKLNALIEDFIQELSTATKKRAQFKNFIILKDRNFNYKMNAGLIIVKFNDYPFVLKLFIEKPATFTKPFAKGFETGVFFIMGDGITRYLAGFTRIPNLLSIQQKITADPYWSQHIVLPRKWYWTPRNNRTFTVTGKNIGTNPEQSIEFPSIYAVICDEIQIERQLHTYHKRDRAIVKEIVQFLGNRIDPHVYNFFIEKGTGKTAIIDTEHIASMIGLHEPIEFHNNTQWYCSLAKKCTYDALFRTKKYRRDIQKRPLSENLKI